VKFIYNEKERMLIDFNGGKKVSYIFLLILFYRLVFLCFLCGGAGVQPDMLYKNHYFFVLKLFWVVGVKVKKKI